MSYYNVIFAVKINTDALSIFLTTLKYAYLIPQDQQESKIHILLSGIARDGFSSFEFYSKEIR